MMLLSREGCTSRSKRMTLGVMANGLKPPIPTRASWMAYVIVFPMLAVAFLTSRIWGTMYGGWRR
jgi:hypothetical protein